MARRFGVLQGLKNIHFVLPKHHESEQIFSKDMLEALELCIENQMLVDCINGGTCLELKLEKTDIFVMETFGGTLFDELQEAQYFRILGPKCILRYFQENEALPSLDMWPVLNTAMYNNLIQFSGFTQREKLSLQKKVKFMGGECIDHSSARRTHLIITTAATKDHQEAGVDKIRIYTKDWINAVWEINLNQYLHANDEHFDQYKASIFMNLVVTTANLSMVEEEEVRILITRNGGTVKAEFDRANVGILITNESTQINERIKSAMSYGIPCLSIKWVRESVELQYPLPHAHYLVKIPNYRQCLSPEKSSQLPASASFNLSAMNSTSRNQWGNIMNETTSKTKKRKVTQRTVKQNARTPHEILYSMKTTCNSTPFGGCTIFCAGFTNHQWKRAEKILTEEIITKEISKKVTHVVVYDDCRAQGEINRIKANGFHPPILKLTWLEDSVKNGELAREQPHLHPKFSEFIDPLDDMESSGSEMESTAEMNGSQTDGIEVSLSQSTSMETRPFEGLTFFVTGFDEKNRVLMKDDITGFGGQLLSGKITKIPDFAVIPCKDVSFKGNAKEIVTGYFIGECVENAELIDIKYYHRPICIPENIKPLCNCCIIISSYNGVESRYLSTLAIALGARYAERVECCKFPRDILYSVTHFICPSSKCTKCSATIRREQPVVTADWLKACANQLKLVKETAYLVDRTVSNTRSTNADEREIIELE